MKGRLLKVVRLRLDHGNGRISQKPWLAHGGVSGPESGDEPSLEATSLQSLGAGMGGGNVTSSNSLIRHPPAGSPSPKATQTLPNLRHLFKMAQGDTVCGKAHPVPAPTSKLMLGTVGTQDSSVSPDIFKLDSPQRAQPPWPLRTRWEWGAEC